MTLSNGTVPKPQQRKKPRVEKPEPTFRRLAEGFYLNIEEPGLSMYRQASGPTLITILGLLRPGTDILLITNFRGDKTKKENTEAFVNLPKQLRSLTGDLHQSGFWLVGY